MRTVDAVLFDIDGTLVDSVDLHAESWQRAFREFGYSISFADIRSQIGKGGDQLRPYFLGEEENRRVGERIEALRKEIYMREYLPRVRSFPGVRDLFRTLLSAGVKVGLASSAKGDELATYKRVAGIEDLVQAETSSDEADKSKPYPDIFRAGLAKLDNPNPAYTVVVGDSPYDAIAAKRAGMHTVGLLCGGFPRKVLEDAGCIAVYASPEDLHARLQTSPLRV